MPIGKVKWLDNPTGYGFIQPDDGSVDVFFHISAFQENGLRPLQKGDSVFFKSEKSPRGPEAITIALLEAVPDYS